MSGRSPPTPPGLCAAGGPKKGIFCPFSGPPRIPPGGTPGGDRKPPRGPRWSRPTAGRRVQTHPGRHFCRTGRGLLREEGGRGAPRAEDRLLPVSEVEASAVNPAPCDSRLRCASTIRKPGTLPSNVDATAPCIDVVTMSVACAACTSHDCTIGAVMSLSRVRMVLPVSDTSRTGAYDAPTHR